MKKKLIILGLLPILCSFLVIKSPKVKESLPLFQIENKKDSPIGRIIIKKINLEENLYSVESKENTIEKNVTILKESIFPDREDSILIIAAHSGTGKIAYFEELDQLEKNDEIILLYKGIYYHYVVKEIWEEKKNGYININKELEKQLVLTTCSPNKNGYQLIINCIEKESN